MFLLEAVVVPFRHASTSSEDRHSIFWCFFVCIMYGHYFLLHLDVERRFVDVLAMLSFECDEVLLCGIEFGSDAFVSLFNSATLRTCG